MSDGGISIPTIIDTLLSDGNAPFTVGGVGFNVRFQQGYDRAIGEESIDAHNVIVTIETFANTRTGSRMLSAYQGGPITINITNSSYEQGSAEGTVAGIEIININTSDVRFNYHTADGKVAKFSLQGVVDHELVHKLTGLPDGLTHNELTNIIYAETGAGPARSDDYSATFLDDHCFLGDTPIQMWPCDLALKPRADGTYDEPLVLSHVWRKPIREIKVGDVVVCYDERGNLQPSPVTSTMKSLASHILDFWGTGVTPGHAYFCADGKFKDKHVPLMDILRSDGAIMRADGTKVRAATNCKLGSMGDRMIHVGATKELPDGTWTQPKPAMARFGTRIILPDGRHRSFMEMAAEEGWKVTEDGHMFGQVKFEDGTVSEQSFKFPYIYGTEVPKPEDYILARSAVTLQEIYAAGEWEQIGTELPAPAGMEDLNSNHKSPLLKTSKPRPNIPPAFANRPDAPVAQTQRAARPSMNRKQRKAMEAKKRKAGKLRKRLVH